MLAIRGSYENVRPTSSGASRCDGPRESEGAAGGCAATRLLDVRHSIHYRQDRACTTAFGYRYSIDIVHTLMCLSLFA